MGLHCGGTCVQGGPFKYEVPRPLEESEIPGIIESYVTAAKNAIAAGFDGVEVRNGACKHPGWGQGPAGWTG